MSEKRPIFGFAVIGIATIIAIVFFVIRGRVSRVDVPLQVSETVSHFAPGVAIGRTVKENSQTLADIAWVPRVGYVAPLSPSSGFVQLRMYPDATTRAKSAGDVAARVQQVEFVSTSSEELTKRMLEMGIVWRGIMPKEGCITSVSIDDPPQRRVQYWTTRSDRGGIALVTDWDLRPKQKPGPVVWSMFTWAGPFDGARDLHAGFEPRACIDSLNLGDPKTDDATEAVEALNVAFRDSVWGSGAQVRQAAEEASAPNATPMTADACSSPGRSGPTQLQSTALFTVDLPDDFKLTNAEKAERDADATGYARYEYRGSDNSRVSIFPEQIEFDRKGNMLHVHSGWTGLIDSECTVSVSGDSVHVDIANASTYGADFVVHGFLYKLPARPMVFIGHARSHARQEQLLYALRSLAVNPRWGSRRVN